MNRSAARPTGDVDPDEHGEPRRGGRAALIWLPLLAFLAGAGLTAAVIAGLAGLGATSNRDPAAEATPTPSAEAGSPADTSGDVPESCVIAAEFNQTFLGTIDEVAVAVRDQDARALQEALDTIQDAQPGAEEASEECQAIADGDAGAQAGGDTEGESEDEDDPSDEPTEGESTPTPTP